jgi:uncharacterized protein (TIGR02231 family)
MMTTRIFSLILVGLSLTPLLNAQVSLEMEPIDANAEITSVTLYRNRAAITRTATLELNTGGYTIFFKDIPSVAYLDSVQASVSDNASLLAVDTSNKPILVENSKLVTELVAQIEEVEAKLIDANSEGNAIILQIELLKTLIEKASNDKAPPIELELFNEQITFAGNRMQDLSAKQFENSNKIRKLKELLINLKQQKHNISIGTKNQIDAIVDIGVANPCEVEVQLTYLVSNASWTPTYSIHANTDGNTISIDYEAELNQKTGENWTDVSLTLSTAQPQQSITPPMPSPWYVDVYQPPQPTSAPRLPNFETKSDSALLERRLSLGTAVEVASAAAAVVGDGPAVSFVLPRTVTIPSDITESQTTSIASIETSAEQYLIAVPMLTDRVFVRSEVTNKSDYILLPGRASIFHGGDYVGKTSLKTIAPNQTFPLDLGIDASVISTRTLVEKVTSSTGLFGSGKQTTYDFQIEISNGNDAEIDIHVYDRIPVSRNEEIEVVLKNISSPLSTNANYLKTERTKGILRWDLKVPANLTGEASFKLTWQVEIARGKDIDITPLPE